MNDWDQYVDIEDYNRLKESYHHNYNDNCNIVIIIIIVFLGLYVLLI